MAIFWRLLKAGLARLGAARTPTDNPESERSARDLAAKALNALDPQTAEAHMASVIATATEAQSFVLFAHLKLIAGDTQQALDLLRKAETIDSTDASTLEGLAAVFEHTGDPAQEYAYRRRRLLCGAAPQLSHVIAALLSLIMAAAKGQPDLRKSDLRLLTSMFRQLEPLSAPPECVRFAELLFSFKAHREEAMALLMKHAPPSALESRRCLGLASVEVLAQQGKLTSHGAGATGLSRAATLPGGSVLPELQWAPWLPDSAEIPTGYFTRKLRTARESPGSQLISHSRLEMLVRLSRNPVRFISRPAVLIGSMSNYYHFLADHLSRFAVLDQLGVDISDALIVTGAELQSFELEFFALLGIESDRLLQVGVQDNVHFERLIAACAPVRSGVEIDPVFPEWARRKFVESRGAMSGDARKLYVSRARAARRRITNETEVIACLSTLGFEAVYPEELTVSEQIDLFSRASEIVAPAGAALTNMVFMPPAGKVTMINSRYLPKSAQLLFFDPLARACGHKFSIVSGTPREFTTDRVLDADFEVSVAELCASLSSS